MKNTILKHRSGVLFEFIEEFQPQFSGHSFVRLLNLKSGKQESFLSHTYKQFFTEL
jgi:hypothetical protein